MTIKNRLERLDQSSGRNFPVVVSLIAAKTETPDDAAARYRVTNPDAGANILFIVRTIVDVRR